MISGAAANLNRIKSINEAIKSKSGARFSFRSDDLNFNEISGIPATRSQELTVERESRKYGWLTRLDKPRSSFSAINATERINMEFAGVGKPIK